MLIFSENGVIIGVHMNQSGLSRAVKRGLLFIVANNKGQSLPNLRSCGVRGVLSGACARDWLFYFMHKTTGDRYAIKYSFPECPSNHSVNQPIHCGAAAGLLCGAYGAINPFRAGMVGRYAGGSAERLSKVMGEICKRISLPVRL